MDILNRINELRIKQNWSIYKLAEESGVNQSTLSNMFSRQTMPSITTLKQICDAFGISMSDFFNNEANEYSDEELNIISNYRKLENNEKLIVKTLIETIIKNK